MRVFEEFKMESSLDLELGVLVQVLAVPFFLAGLRKCSPHDWRFRFCDLAVLGYFAQETVLMLPEGEKGADERDAAKSWQGQGHRGNPCQVHHRLVPDPVRLHEHPEGCQIYGNCLRA